MNYPIDYNSYRARSYNKRVRFLVLHYTAVGFRASVNSLTENVSSHYLVPDPTEATYDKKNLCIFNLVDEGDRAWHAGVSQWENHSNINDQSIGIEIVNLASYDPKQGFTFPAYNDEQINAVIELCHNIITRYPDITPTRVVGHADIAPARKSDPGPAFPWHRLYQQGIGAWYDEETKAQYAEKYKACGIPSINDIQKKMAAYGYAINVTGVNDEQTKACIGAFQMHFRPSKYDGDMDIETAATLSALVEKYK